MGLLAASVFFQFEEEKKSLAAASLDPALRRLLGKK
jgi:hypothetical protein